MLKKDLPSVWRRIKITLHLLNPQLAEDIEELYRLACKNRALQLKAYDDILLTVKRRRQAVAQTLAESLSDGPLPETANPVSAPEATPAETPQTVETAGKQSRRKPQYRDRQRRSAAFKDMSQAEVDNLHLDLMEARARSIDDFRRLVDRTVAKLGSTEPGIRRAVISLSALSPKHRGNLFARLISGAKSAEERKNILKRLAKHFKLGSRELQAQAKASTYWKAKVE